MTEKSTQKAEIGNFTKPEGVAAVESFMGGTGVGSVAAMPKEKKKSGEDAGEDAPEAKQQTMEEVTDEISKLESDIEKVREAPELTYEGRLQRHGVTKEEAEKIIDAMMIKGEYRKTYQITPKYNVTFKTRLLEDQNRALDVIEVKSPQYPSTVGNIVAEQNLASSIIRFRDIDFSEKDIKVRLEWVRKLPDTVARILANKLSKFDELIMDVLDEGAIENF